VIKSIEIKFAGHLARVGKIRGSYRILVDDLREREHLEDLTLIGEIILKCIFIMLNRAWTRMIWLKIRTDRVVMKFQVS